MERKMKAGSGAGQLKASAESKVESKAESKAEECCEHLIRVLNSARDSGCISARNSTRFYAD
jgi:hypothetical protein